jgi:hypothetical protein
LVAVGVVVLLLVDILLTAVVEAMELEVLDGEVVAAPLKI